MKRWLRHAGYLGLAVCFAVCLCSAGPACADYVLPPEETLFARASAIVDATVTHVEAQKHVAIKLNEILRGRKCPPVLTGHLGDGPGQLGQFLKRTQRYILILYGQNVYAYFPVRLIARRKREVQYEQTWISFEAFAKRLPVELTPNEKDPRKVLAAISESGGDVIARAHPSLKASKEFVRIAVRISGNALRHAGPAARKDPEIVLGATGYNAPAWPHAHADLWKDPTFVLRLRRAVPASVCILRKADPKLRDDRELVLQVVKVNGSELAFASQRLRKDRQIVQAAGFRGLGHHADMRWRDDKTFMLAIVKLHGNWLGLASERLKADREVVLTAARSSGYDALNYAAPKLRCDREIVLAAVRNNGRCLRLAAEPLRGDREVVLAAVQSDGEALRSAAPKFRKDKQICLAAVRQKGAIIQLVDDKTPGYREIAVEAVRQDGRALSRMPLEFRKDRRVVMAAVSQRGRVLGLASPEIRGDRDIVLAAAKNEVVALGGAAGRLLGDPEFILTAAKQSPGALAYAIGPASLDSRIIALRNDRAGILRAVRKGDFYALQGASNRLRSDPEFMLQAITSGGEKTVAANVAAPALWDNPRFVLRAIEANPWILRFAPWRVRADRKYVLAAVAKEGLTFALADRTVRGDETVAATALRSNPKLADSFDHMARGGVQWCPKVRAAYEAAVCAGPAGPGGQGPKYLSPTAMVADSAGKTIYIAEATAGQVAVFDIATRKVTRAIAVGGPVSGVALSPDGARLYVTAGAAEGRLCVVDVKSRTVTARIRAGHTPMSPVVSRDGKTVYVCNRFNNAVGVVDVAAGRQRATIAVPREPISADLSKDGSVLLVANHLPAGAANAEHVAAEVSIVDTAAGKIASTIKLPDGSTCLRAVRVSPDGRYAAVTHTLAKPCQPTTALERIRYNTNALSIIDVPGGKLINTVLADDLFDGAANSWALAWSADSKTLCITHAGAHEMSVIDVRRLLAKLTKAAAAGEAGKVPNDRAFLIACRRRLKLAGNGPRCMALVGTRAFVGEYFTDSLSVLDISPEVRPNVQAVALGAKSEMTTVRRGEMLFNDARLSHKVWESCASCHPDGRSDGLNRDLLGDGMGNPKNTKSLLWAHKTPPSLLMGHRKNAKVAVRAQIRFILFSVQPEQKALAIDEYLESLKPVPSPLLVDGKLSPAARRGEKLFKTAACSSCHSGAILTDQKRHDVGTAIGDKRYLPQDRKFDTPTLIEAWRTGPYLYNGRARTILDVLSKKHNAKDRHGKTSNLTGRQLADLAAYVRSL